jgi:exonuclease III
MRIVSWNCGGDNSHKGKLDVTKVTEMLEMVKTPNPDILVVQEITLEECLNLQQQWHNPFWYGDGTGGGGSYRGIAVFSNTCKIEFTKEFCREFRYVVPYKITKNNKPFVLFAVWTKNETFPYDNNISEAIKSPEYKEIINGDVVIIGDFNTFAKTETDLQNLEKKISPFVSCTKDLTPTYYHAENNMGVDDFCCVSTSMKEKFKGIQIPDGWDDKKDKFHRWRGLSDHCPIIVDFDF